MIEMIAGVFGLPIKDKSGKTIRIKGMGPGDGPFSVSPEREAELVKKGIARYVNDAPTDTDDTEIPNDAPTGFDEMPPEDGAEDELSAFALSIRCGDISPSISKSSSPLTAYIPPFQDALLASLLFLKVRHTRCFP